MHDRRVILELEPKKVAYFTSGVRRFARVDTAAWVMPPEEFFASTAPSETLWTISDVARFFGCTVRHVHNLQAAGLPYFHLGRLVRFDPAEVRAYLQTNRCIVATRARRAARDFAARSPATFA